MSPGPGTARSWRQSLTSIVLHNGESNSRPQPADSASPVSEERSPHEPTTALILEPDDPSLFLSFDEGEELTSIISSPVNISAFLPAGLAPLPFFALQLFLVAPSLLLGATALQEAVNAQGVGFSRIYMSILWCVAAAFLASLSSQIWVVAARYVRRWSIEEIIAQALVGGSGRRAGLREIWRKRVVITSRAMLVLLSALTCFIYLHDAAAMILRDAVKRTPLGHAVIALLFAVVLTYFLLPTTMGSRRLWVSMSITVTAHFASMVIMCIRSGRSIEDRGSNRLLTMSVPPFTSINWEGLNTLAFSFANPFLVFPLYVSRLVPIANSSVTAPRRWRIPFPLHTLVANLISTILLCPLVLILPHYSQPHPVLRSLALLFGIPTLWVLALVPRLPSPPSSSSPSPLSIGKHKHALWTFIISLSVIVPPEASVMATLRRVLMFCMLFTAYLLPALLHIALHMLRPPLTILIGIDDEDAPNDPEHGQNHASGSREDAALIGDTDALLRRKERTLQRRRLGRRMAWDLSVWIILLPLGLAMTVWSGGRLFGQW